MPLRKLDNISINFWTLAATLSGRADPAAIQLDWASAEEMDEFETIYPEAEVPKLRVPAVTTSRPAGARAVNRMQIAPSGIASTCDSPAPRPAFGGSPPRPGAALSFTSISPNPSRAGFGIHFATSSRGAPVSLSIYDAAGRRVRTLMTEALEPGAHSIEWDGRDATGRPCGGGTYFAALRRGDDLEVTRLLLVR